MCVHLMQLLSQVLLAQLKNTEKFFAMKVLKKDEVIEDDVEATLVERRILALGTECPFITQLHCTFQTEVGGGHLYVCRDVRTYIYVDD